MLSTIKLWLFTLLCCCTFSAFAGDKFSDPVFDNTAILAPDLQLKADSIYDSLKLGDAGLERDIFYKTFKGYLYFLYQGRLSNPNVITIADFSQSSKNKRLYIIDLAKMELVINTYVSHGKNSGAEMATSFSNLKDSYKSTLGFLVTADTYKGTAGYSLRFDGLEPGINDRVRNRDIIVHGSRYVNAERAEENGRVGNSLGCPAVPLELSHKIIDYIKGGTLYFMYHPDEYYNASSAVLNGLVLAPSQPGGTSLIGPINSSIVSLPAIMNTADVGPQR